MPPLSKKISAIITNYQGRDLVQRCISSLLKDTYSVEIIVVDNGSTDGSVECIQEHFGGRVKTIILANNPGPAAAWNSGIEAAQGEILLLLDNDTEVQLGTLAALDNFFANNQTVGVAQCKLLRLQEPTQIDSVGEYLSPLGFLIHRAPYRMVDRGQFETPDEIFAAKSAAMAVRKSAFIAAGPFDESYFQYVIETDFCWRVWLVGYRVVYCPNTSVWHQWGGSERLLTEKQKLENISYQGTRNLILTLLKNLQWWSVLEMVSLTASALAGLAVWRALHGDLWRAHGIARGLGGIMMQIPTLWKKRQAVQRQRMISDRQLFRRVMRYRSLFYFIKQANLPYRTKKRRPTVTVKRI